MTTPSASPAPEDHEPDEPPPRGAQRALGPVAAGLILDVVDLATFGPIGLFVGFVAGAAAGYYLASLYRFTPGQRVGWSIAAGIYCTLPFTEFLPVATILSAAHEWFHAPRTPGA